RPHCQTPCQVAAQNLGVPVKCAQCGRPLIARPPTSPGSPRVAPLRLDVGAATSSGRVRLGNEDSYLVHHLVWSNRNERRESALLVVADGMGGHEGGERASGVVIQHLGTALVGLLGVTLDGPPAPAAAGLLAALH